MYLIAQYQQKTFSLVSLFSCFTLRVTKRINTNKIKITILPPIHAEHTVTYLRCLNGVSRSEPTLAAWRTSGHPPRVERAVNGGSFSLDCIVIETVISACLRGAKDAVFYICVELMPHRLIYCSFG